MRTSQYCILALTFALATSISHGQIAILGETIYTMAGKPISNGVVLIKGSTIERVGPASEIAIPANYKLLKGKIVTPGLIDAHSVVGLSGIYNQAHDQDQLELSEAIQPELRALDAYNPREQLVEWVRSFGTTTLHTGPAPGALSSGQTMIVKTVGGTVADALVDSTAMVTFTLGSSVTQNLKTPGTRAKSMAMLRSEFLKARDYAEKKKVKDTSKHPATDLRMEALLKVLNREQSALFTAQRATEIMSALRLAKEFGFKIVLDGAAESYLVVDEIKKAGVPVITHPTMVRVGGETKNASFETASVLKRAGVTVALQSGYESYVPKTRVVLFEAAIAAANGLSFEEALGTITIDAARVIGKDKRIGSLEPGKDADVVLFDGDPFEYTTHVCSVVVNGQIVNDTCK